MGCEALAIRRFLSYVRIDEWGCWVWEGGRSRGQGNKDWYGTFWNDGVSVRAHIFSHDTFKGKPPQGWHRDHRCRDFGAPRDNSLCVNPRHIHAVSPIKNNIRRWRKDAADNALVLGPYHCVLLGWSSDWLDGFTGPNGRVHHLAGDLNVTS